MSILASQEFNDQILSGGFEKSVTLGELAERLRHITPESLRQDPDIHRLRPSKEEIYVLRLRGLRVFLTISENNVVVLSAMEHG